MTEALKGEWQPIETAPKDGTDVLIWCAGAQVEMARWLSDSHPIAKHKGGSGWFEPYTFGSQYPASHWMPLPTPPEAV